MRMSPAPFQNWLPKLKKCIWNCKGGRRMDNSERISTMEKHLNDYNYALARLEDALDQFEKKQTDLAVLSEYYGSETWYADSESDDEGKLPPTLARGVLTEDLVYNALMENHTVSIKLLEVATKIIKER